MIRSSPAGSPVLIGEAVAGSGLSQDAPWLVTMAAVTALELAWWAVTWLTGLAPAPHVFTYLVLAFLGLAAAALVQLALQRPTVSPNWASTIPATLLVGLGASLFLPLKYAIPKLLPFWFDEPLSTAERAFFTTDPWLLLDRYLGWAAVPMDRFYGLWLPTQTLLLFVLMLQPASVRKSRALIAYVLAWFVLGVVAATLFSSAGPIFYDRLFGGTSFSGLTQALHRHGAWVAQAESDKMWDSLTTGRPSLVAGISAVPSIHVAISFWMFLAARTMAPRAVPYALIYTALIWIGSVQLGWHYVTDGLLGVLGMSFVWHVSSRILTVLRAQVAGADVD